MSTRDLIDAIESGSATDIQTAFEGEMASRIAERLDTMRQEVSKNMFNEARKVSSKMAEDEHKDEEDDEDEDELDEMSSKEKMKRGSYNKEDVDQIDELSGDTVASYHYKAGRDLAKRGGSSASGPATDADKQKVSARRAGMSRALPRIMRSIRNEDVDANVDEAMDQSKVHPNALHVKPVGGGKYKVHAVGKNFAHGMKAGEHLSDSELDDFAEMGGKVKHVK